MLKCISAFRLFEDTNVMVFAKSLKRIWARLCGQVKRVGIVRLGIMHIPLSYNSLQFQIIS